MATLKRVYSIPMLLLKSVQVNLSPEEAAYVTKMLVVVAACSYSYAIHLYQYGISKKCTGLGQKQKGHSLQKCNDAFYTQTKLIVSSEKFEYFEKEK